MSETAHTPGPWSVVAGDDYLVISDATPEQFPHRFKGDDLGRFVASIGNRSNDFGEADARLIAAAPDMLAALRGIENRFDTYEGLTLEGITRDQARAAIAKATGVA